MRAGDLPALRPLPGESAAQEYLEQLEQGAQGVFGLHANNLSQGREGPRFRDPEVQQCWGVIISNPIYAQSGSGSGSNPCSGQVAYEWYEQIRLQCDALQPDDYRRGALENTLGEVDPTGTGRHLAYEVNNSDTVVKGTVVRMFLAADGEHWEFAQPGSQGDGVPGSGSGSGGQNYIDVVTGVCLIVGGSGSGSGG